MPPKTHPNAQKQKFHRTSYSLQTKMKILELYDTDPEQLKTTLEKRKINRTTFLTWLRNKDTIKASASQRDITKTKRFRQSPLAIVDQALIRWFYEKRATEKDLRLRDQDLLDKAQEFFDQFSALGMLSKKRWKKPHFSDLILSEQSKTSTSEPKPLKSFQASTQTTTSTSKIIYPAIPEIYKGIYNPSRLCYVSVILQTLFLIPQFRQWILSIDSSINILGMEGNNDLFLYGKEKQDALIQQYHLHPLNNDLERFVTCIPVSLSSFRKSTTRGQSFPKKAYDALRYFFSLLSTPVYSLDGVSSVDEEELQTLQPASQDTQLPATTEQQDTSQVTQLPTTTEQQPTPPDTTTQPTSPTKRQLLASNNATYDHFLNEEGLPRVARHDRTSILSAIHHTRSYIFEISRTIHLTDPVDPTAFLASYLDSNDTMIDLAVQGDSHEYFIDLMNNLSLYYYSANLPILPRKLFWCSYIERKRCCRNHSVVKASLDGSYGISIPIQSSSLEETLTLLHNGMETEPLHCKYCEAAGLLQPTETTECKNSLSFTQLPNTLFFHLERFVNDKQTKHQKKIITPFTFPLDKLDLSPYSHFERPPPGTSEERQYVDYHLYKLVGVICHAGTISSGHYFTFIRERTGAQRWILFNDEGVSAVNIVWLKDYLFGTYQKQRSEAMRFYGCCAYILVYEREIPIDVWAFEQQLMEEVCPSNSYKFFSFRNTEDVHLAKEIRPPSPALLIDVEDDSEDTDCESAYSESTTVNDKGNNTSDGELDQESCLEGGIDSNKENDTEKRTDEEIEEQVEKIESHSTDYGINSRGKSTSPPYGELWKLHANLTLKSQTIDHSWVFRWRQRHGIKYTTFTGEAADSNVEAGNRWLETEFKQILSSYDRADIFNADETGIFYKRLPTKGLIRKGEIVRGSKVNKSRITALVAASMLGEKLPLFIIGVHSHVKMRPLFPKDVTYAANSNAWMTRGLFEV